MIEKSRILNLEICKITQRELLEQLNEGVLFTPNVDHLVKLQKDKDFWDIYQKADWVICDSRILYYSMKLIGRKVPEPIPGSSFFTNFYQSRKYDSNCKIFLLGGEDGVAEKASKRINNKIGREIIIGSLSPSYGFEKKEKECLEICDAINKSKANVVLVGVGAPKQEKWIMKYKPYMPDVKIWMALGATIDFEAGHKKRAPKFMRKMALEWLFRLLQEPRRMFKRYMCDDLVFFWYLFKDALGIYKSPFSSDDKL